MQRALDRDQTIFRQFPTDLTNLVLEQQSESDREKIFSISPIAAIAWIGRGGLVNRPVAGSNDEIYCFLNSWRPSDFPMSTRERCEESTEFGCLVRVLFPQDRKPNQAAVIPVSAETLPRAELNAIDLPRLPGHIQQFLELLPCVVQDSDADSAPDEEVSKHVQ